MQNSGVEKGCQRGSGGLCDHTVGGANSQRKMRNFGIMGCGVLNSPWIVVDSLTPSCGTSHFLGPALHISPQPFALFFRDWLWVLARDKGFLATWARSIWLAPCAMNIHQSHRTVPWVRESTTAHWLGRIVDASPCQVNASVQQCAALRCIPCHALARTSTCSCLEQSRLAHRSRISCF